MQNYRDLKVWGKAHALTLVVYRETERFPSGEKVWAYKPNATSSGAYRRQYRRRMWTGQRCGLCPFLQMAFGSASELEYFTLLARDLRFCSDTAHDEVIACVQEVKRMLAALIDRLKADS